LLIAVIQPSSLPQSAKHSWWLFTEDKLQNGIWSTSISFHCKQGKLTVKIKLLQSALSKIIPVQSFAKCGTTPAAIRRITVFTKQVKKIHANQYSYQYLWKISGYIFHSFAAKKQPHI
jgi:hypothetical protein